MTRRHLFALLPGLAALKAAPAPCDPAQRLYLGPASIWPPPYHCAPGLANFWGDPVATRQAVAQHTSATLKS